MPGCIFFFLTIACPLQISDLVQAKARKLLLPLLNTILRRSLYVIRRTFDIAINVISRDYSSEPYVFSDTQWILLIINRELISAPSQLCVIGTI